MINKTLRKTNYVAPSDASLYSDLHFQFDFEDHTILFVSEEVKLGYFQRLKAKWLDYRNELGLILTAYCLIFSMIAFFGANMFDQASSFKKADLSVVPLAAISNLYSHFDSKTSSTKVDAVSSDLEIEPNASLPVLMEENGTPTPVVSTVIEPSQVAQVAEEPIVSEEKGRAITEKTAELKTTVSQAQKTGVDIISEEYQQLIQQIAGEGKYALLKFGAKWCVPCQIMEETVFQDDQVNQYLNQHFKSLHVDVDHFDGYNLKQHYSISGIPAFVILNAAGKEIGRYNKAMSTMEMRDVLSMYQHSSLVQK